VRWDFVERGPATSTTAGLFHPGPTDSAVSYAAVLAQMPTELRAIALSPAGHGDSEKPGNGFRIEDFARDVVVFCDKVGVERAVLVGHSGSCLVARRACLDAPDRFAGLVLEASPTTLRGDARLQGFVDEIVMGLRDPIDSDFARGWIADTSAESLEPALVDALVAEVRKVPAHVWHEMFASLVVYDDMDELAGLVAPTLLVWGDADEIVRRDMQDQLLARILNARLEVYAGAGHAPRWEHPGRFAVDVAAFARPLLR
jgi:pimeloyl-ACP methyl ester carboxylesterase